MSATASNDRRELAHRYNDGFDVTLFWNARTDRVTITVLDSHADDTLEFEVEGSVALDAFNHPFAYAAARPAPNLATTSVSAAGM